MIRTGADRVIDRFVGSLARVPALARMGIQSREKLAEKYRLIFDTPDGRDVLRHIVRMAHVDRSTFVKDVNVMLVREGERRLALSILRMVCRDHEELQQTIEDSLNAS